MFAPLLYPLAVVAGIAARELIERGAHTEVLLRDRTEALAAERERLRVARELHDSLAKTVEGLALTASVLPARCERNPAVAARVARQLAVDARQAALEARALMSDLRPSAVLDALAEALRRRAESFAERSGVRSVLAAAGTVPDRDRRPARAAAHRRRGTRNAVRHGGASEITVSLDGGPGEMRLAVADDGHGLPRPVDVEQLKTTGHFGMAGMHERARAIGGALEVGSADGGGTVVSSICLAPRTPPRALSATEEELGVDVPRVRILGLRRARRSGVRA